MHIYLSVYVTGWGVVSRRFDTRSEAEAYVESMREKYGPAVGEPTYRTPTEHAEKLSRGHLYHDVVASYED